MNIEESLKNVERSFMYQPSLFHLPPAPVSIRMVNESDVAFCLGQFAGECGQSVTANPYILNSREYLEWMIGWQDGRERASEPPWEWWAYLDAAGLGGPGP